MLVQVLSPEIGSAVIEPAYSLADHVISRASDLVLLIVAK